MSVSLRCSAFAGSLRQLLPRYYCSRIPKCESKLSTLVHTPNKWLLARPFVSTTSSQTEGILQSRFTVEIPENVSHMDFVYSKFDEYKDDVAIVDGVSGRNYTYRQLQDLTRRFGSALTRRGFAKGDVLAIHLPNMPEFPIVFFGVGSVGGVSTTINPAHTMEEVCYQLKDSGAKFIVTASDLAETAQKAAAKAGLTEVFVIGEADGCTPFSTLLEDDGSSLPRSVQINPKEDVYCLPYSSGTTGLPKGVMLTHDNLTSEVCTIMHEEFTAVPLTENTITLAVLPFFHIFGMVVVLAKNLYRGGKIVSMEKFDGEVMLKLIQDQKIKSANIVPPIVTFLAKHPLVDKYDLTSLQTLTSGAAPLGEDVTEAVKRRLPSLKTIRQVINGIDQALSGAGYGLTETSPAVMLDRRNHVTVGSVGVLLPRVEAKVTDLKTDAALGPNQDGEICVRGPVVMKGYLNKPEATADTIDKDGWFHTGDIGHYDENEQFFIVDRLKELIKYKGFQVAPAELEDIIHGHPKVLDVAVIGVSNPESGEVPKAFVVHKDPAAPATEEEIQSYVAERVAPHKKLRGGVEFTEAIPKTASGKILRRVLKDMVKDA